jgi:ribosomal protein S18 acetylase RimI-like enzyme
MITTQTSAVPAHPLDNVIWQALSSRQAGFAKGSGGALRFVPEVGPLAGFATPGTADFEALAALAGPGPVAVFLDAPFERRSGWKVVDGGPLVQMVWQKDKAPETIESGTFDRPAAAPEAEKASGAEVLGAADSGAMMELTRLTKPGPFSTRTHELGSFFGIWREGSLVAMAGERMKVLGHTEVSAVCTHPGHTGKGYAALLMRRVMRGILDRGETPFLHARADNTRAISLYERLGFRPRLAGHFVVLVRAGIASIYG